MPDRSQMPNRNEMALLARQAGLSLDEPYFSELVESYEHVHAMLVRQREAVNDLMSAPPVETKGGA